MLMISVLARLKPYRIQKFQVEEVRNPVELVDSTFWHGDIDLEVRARDPTFPPVWI